PVELPNHDNVDSASADVGKEPGPGAPVGKVAGRRGVDVLGRLPASGLDILTHRLELELRVLVLIPGRDPSIEGNAGWAAHWAPPLRADSASTTRRAHRPVRAAACLSCDRPAAPSCASAAAG